MSHWLIFHTWSPWQPWAVAVATACSQSQSFSLMWERWMLGWQSDGVGRCLWPLPRSMLWCSCLPHEVNNTLLYCHQILSPLGVWTDLSIHWILHPASDFTTTNDMLNKFQFDRNWKKQEDIAMKSKNASPSGTLMLEFQPKSSPFSCSISFFPFLML